MNAWEIWWADVRFQDSPEQKRRPVIVLDERTVLVLALYVTSASPRPGHHDFPLIDWASSGLTKPSTVRLDKTLSLKHSQFISKIGAVSQRDKILIKARAPFPLR